MAKKLRMIVLVVCLGLSVIMPLAHSEQQTEPQQVAAAPWTPDGPKPGVGG